VKLIPTLLAAGLLPALFVSPAYAAPATGQVTVVQAVPGADVDIAVDGKSVKTRAGVGTLVGPLALASGRHQLVFTGAPGGRTIKTSVKVTSGSNSDVVLHLPASVDGEPVVNTYRTSQSPIGPGKARVLLAHTATVAPADVRLDGKVVFTNIANGEFADADVPAGAHRAELLATGTTKNPILGPLDVNLADGTATMVYAVGNPRNGSMNVIAHTVKLSSDGSVAPSSVATGSAGLARLRSTPFSTARPTDSTADSRNEGDRPVGGRALAWLVAGLGMLLVVSGAAISTRSRPGGRRQPTSVWPNA
jgi:hypothetical protein